MFQKPPRREGFLVFLMLASSLSIIYCLYHFNPFFMNRKPLSKSLSEGKEQVLPVPTFRTPSDEKLTNQFNIARNIGRSYQEPSDFSIYYSFFRKSSTVFYKDKNLAAAPLWSYDSDSVFLIDGKKLRRLNLDLEVQWWFELQKQDKFADRATVSDTEVFVATQRGQLYRLDKSSGKLQWMIGLESEIVYSPVIYRSFLFLILKNNADEYFLTKLNGITGEVIWNRELVGFTEPSRITISSETSLVLVTDPNGSLLCLDVNTGNAYWQKKKLGEIRGPATAVGEMAFVATQDAKAYGIQLKRKSVSWEYTLSSASKNPFTYIPIYDYVALLTDSGYMHVIDVNSGEGIWKYNTGNSQPNQAVFTVKLDSKSIQHLKLKWKYRGWVLVTPCTEDRLCVMNPANGQLLTRYNLRGKSASTPVFIGKNLYLTLKDPQKMPWIKNDTPNPKFSLARLSTFHPTPKESQ